MKWFARIKSELNKISFLRSIRFRMSVVIVLVGVICCCVMCFGILQSYFYRAIEVRTGDIQNQMKVLADHLVTYNYLQNPSSDVVNAELEQFSTLYEGRVIIINDRFTVIKDTYHLSQGKFIISEEVIRCFKGESVSNYDDANKYIEMTIPIQINSGESNQVAGVILVSVSTKSIENNYNILNHNALLISCLVMTGVIIVAVGVSHFMMRPFDRVTKEINNLKEGFSEEIITVNDYVETEKIVTAFNQLWQRMKVLDDSRQDFVSNVSHELKTPMTSIKVLADSLNTQEDVPVEIYKEFMTDIVAEIDRENDIINDLLSLVKLDKSSSDLNILPVNINKMVEGIFKLLKPLANEKKVDLIFQSHREVIAEVDEIKLSLAIMNLIENGIKYNREEGGWVEVILDADHQFFMLEVSDNGIGIGEEDKKHIFERFYRVDKSHSREINGTGLGLAITRSTVLKHRGSIKVSGEEGEGTVFSVKIPLSYIQ